MKKILNLAIVAVAALGLFGCANSVSVKQTEVGGSTKITNGAFEQKGFKDSATGISISEAKTTKEAKVVKFDANSSFKLFKGDKSHGLDHEQLTAPKNIKYSDYKNYTVYEEYYDVSGKIATKYVGQGIDTKKYPAEDALNWTKYTYYNGEEGKEEFAKDKLWPFSPDYSDIPEGTSEEYEYSYKFCRDHEETDYKDGKEVKVKVDESEYAVVAIAGKLYSVISLGNTDIENDNKDFEEYKKETHDKYVTRGWKWDSDWGYPSDREVTNIKIEKGSDTITYTKESYATVYNKESTKTTEYGMDTYTHTKAGYKETKETYVFKTGGKVTYKKEYKEEINGKAINAYVEGNKDGDAASGNWTNNNGLIAIAFKDFYKNTTATTSEWVSLGLSCSNDHYLYLYWNGEQLGDAYYIGALYDGSIPSAATSTANENDYNQWGF